MNVIVIGGGPAGMMAAIASATVYGSLAEPLPVVGVSGVVVESPGFVPNSLAYCPQYTAIPYCT